MTTNLHATSSISSGESQRNELLLRELVSGLSNPVAEGAVSVGLVGSLLHAPQPPGHCLQTCLGGDAQAIAERGCGLLISAAKNECPGGEKPVRCPRGFQFAAQQTSLGGSPATLVTLQGPLPAVSSSGAAPLLQRLDDVARLVQHVGQLLEENSGFADEVLRSYEQLNLIFDLTQQISQITDVPAIERLLMERIGTLLGVAHLWILDRADRARVFDIRGRTTTSAGPPRDAAALATEVRRTRQVHVSVAGDRPLIAGPLMRLDSNADVVLAQRPPNRPAFTSGDMMIFESVLTFGGQIISNSELHERLRQWSVQVTWALVAAIGIGGSSDEGQPELTVDGNGNVYVTGYIRSSTVTVYRRKQPFGTSYVEQTLATLSRVSGGSDVFVIKLSPTLDYVWGKVFGGPGDDKARGLVTQLTDDLVVVGFMGNGVTLPGCCGIAGKGGRDGFGVLLSRSSGAILGGVAIGGSGDDEALDVATIPGTGRLFVAGNFSGTMQVGPYTLSSRGGRDAYIAEFDRNGNVYGAGSAGGGGREEATALARASGVGTVAGFFESSVLEPLGIAKQGSLADAFVVRLNHSQ